MSRFSEALAVGHAGETQIAKWLVSRGNTVVPAYEIEIQRGKGPRVYSPAGPIVAPDLCVIRGGRVIWVEAKHKTTFTWRRNRPGPRWETGVDLHHWREYQRVQKATGAPVWLLFLHRESEPAPQDRPHVPAGETSPVGLFGICMDQAVECARISDQYAGGMAYWGVNDLVLLDESVTDVVALDDA